MMPKQPKNLAGKDLRNINVSTDDLQAADLSGTTLSGALLRGVDLTGANLSEANLRGAHLEGANLSSANLRNTDLTDADVRGARIEAATNLEGVRLRNAKGLPEPLSRLAVEPAGDEPTSASDEGARRGTEDAPGSDRG
jgi:uncharacterized protein YjbI with pentapeptide repeats